MLGIHVSTGKISAIIHEAGKRAQTYLKCQMPKGKRALALDEQYGAATSFITDAGKESEQPKGGEKANGKVTIAGLIEEEIILPLEGTKTRLQEKLAAGEFVVSVELDPPKGLNPAKILEGAALLQ